ncbi:hypothetical protein ACFW93_02105 [Streptomyces canus]|uniref:hypothetical protein n=1 Tax=Streptomyces canus TaxID=58343 RepID=UPI0036BFF9D8
MAGQTRPLADGRRVPRPESDRAVVISGTVPSAQCRETVLRTVREELAGLAVHTDVVVAENVTPDYAEELP